MGAISKRGLRNPLFVAASAVLAFAAAFSWLFSGAAPQAQESYQDPLEGTLQKPLQDPLQAPLQEVVPEVDQEPSRAIQDARQEPSQALQEPLIEALQAFRPPPETAGEEDGPISEAPHSETALDIRPGDVVFQSLNTPQTAALIKATGSAWTHCGVVADRGGRLVVQEALMVMVETPLEDWIARGRGEIAVTRLKASSALTPEVLKALDEEFKKFRGKRYDFWFQWSDDKIYCSELVQKMFERVLGIELSPLRKVSDYDLSDPVVKKLIEKRFPKGLDPSEPAVAPVDLLESALMERVN